MRKSVQIFTVVGVIASAAGARAFCTAVPGEAIQVTRVLGDGSVLVVSTGTSSGRCVAERSSVSCSDGASYAYADLETGCGARGGAGYCLIARSGDLEVDAAGTSQEKQPLESKIDVKCGSGSLRGTVFTVGDGDGSGSCGPDRAIDGRIVGATCSKNGSECTNVNCNDGCTSASANCSCAIKRSPGSSGTNP